MFLAFVLYFLTSFSFILIKESLFFAKPFFLVALRLLLAGSLLLAYHKFFQRKNFAIARKDYWLFLLVSLLSVCITNCLDIWSLQYLFAAKVALIYTLTPFVGALISAIMFKEYLSRTKWIGLLIGFAGILPVILYGGQMGAFSTADLAVVISAFTTVIGWSAVKELVQNRSYSPIIVNGVTLFIGGCFALLFSVLTELWHPLPVFNGLYCFVFVIASALVAHIISYNLYGYLLRRYNMIFMTFLSLTSPLFTAILGRLFLQEQVTGAFYISLIMLSVGLFIFYKNDLTLLRKK